MQLGNFVEIKKNSQLYKGKRINASKTETSVKNTKDIWKLYNGTTKLYILYPTPPPLFILKRKQKNAS